MLIGPKTNVMSYQVKSLWDKVMKYGEYKGYRKCSSCKGKGFNRNTGSACERCQGWGFFKTCSSDGKIDL